MRLPPAPRAQCHIKSSSKSSYGRESTDGQKSAAAASPTAASTPELLYPAEVQNYRCGPLKNGQTSTSTSSVQYTCLKITVILLDCSEVAQWIIMYLLPT